MDGTKLFKLCFYSRLEYNDVLLKNVITGNVEKLARIPFVESVLGYIVHVNFVTFH